MSVGRGFASRMRWSVTIFRADAIDDGTASIQGPMIEVGQRWAEKVDASDGERMRAAQNGQSITSRFIVRHDSLTASLTGKDTLKCEGVRYEIIGVKEWGGRRVGLEITTTAQPDQRA